MSGGAKGSADDRVALRLRDGRRLDAQSAAEVLARIGVVVDARSIDLRDTATCLQTGDQRGRAASPDDQRAGGRVGAVAWSRARSASVMAG